MTLFIPDISHHQGDIDIAALQREGAAALIARVGQGPGVTRAGKNYGLTRDRKWARNRDEAQALHLPLVAYWYVGNKMDPDMQATTAANWCGDPHVPWMIDFEDASGTIPFYHQVLAAWQERGLRAVLGYIPKWYFDSMGGGRLVPGPPIVNSRYSLRKGTPQAIYGASGGDTGAGWIDYGGNYTALWQFTDQASMAGQAIDCSAFRGNYNQLMELLGYDTPAQPVPQPSVQPKEEEVPKIYYVKGNSTTPMPAPHQDVKYGDCVFLVEADAAGMKRRHIQSEELRAAGATATQHPQAWVDAIPLPGGLFPWENAGGGPVPGEPAK